MENILPDNKANNLTKKSVMALIICAALSAFWVIFLWNFWTNELYALGLNAFIFLSLFTGFFIWILHREKRYITGDLTWIIPLGLIILSNLLFDNPFIKGVNMLVFPAAFAIFYNYAFLNGKKTVDWDFNFFFKTAIRIISFLGKIPGSVLLYLELIIPASNANRKIISRIIFGLILFFIVAGVIFIPLLSSADAVFAGKIGVVIDWLKEVLAGPILNKIIAFIVFSVLTAAVYFAWGKEFVYQSKETEKKLADPIIAGIVLGGILVLYLLFLWVQIERLWVGALPFDFKATEDLVKSGFWQLFFLSVINIIIYFFTYKRTSPVVQKILLAFTSVSLLLLASAGYRMGLYVTSYGFSYEKFFASYTVVYCAILFGWLITRLFINKRSNIVKFLIVLFIWMYGIVAVLPVEQFIFRTNINLSQREQSRIKMYELTMLSPDVLGTVKDYKSRGLLIDDYVALEDLQGAKVNARFNWDAWIEKQDQRVREKKWYERNIMNMIYLSR